MKHTSMPHISDEMERWVESMGTAYTEYSKLDSVEYKVCESVSHNPLSGFRPMEFEETKWQMADYSLLMDVIFVICAHLHVLSPSDMPLAYIIFRPEFALVFFAEDRLANFRRSIEINFGSVGNFFSDMNDLKKKYAFDRNALGKDLTSKEIREKLAVLQEETSLKYLEALLALTDYTECPLKKQLELYETISYRNFTYNDFLA